ncbi:MULTISPECIES: hypothetical protein [Symbiopectobacterium]|uniref:hypothetical protein n=1 Tax=Symbiopectobacterium TaxID=801 RepID=UPI001A29071B|nr:MULTISPECIES: hypothetical protein [Symbiopectobacterium]MBG6249385.1 hypothetical protein [Candidatus Symbiopectobacterium sp. PLON1]MBT9428156.1 hypothetical protein [Candidatus Symbiopectobacterium endolongispinus]
MKRIDNPRIQLDESKPVIAADYYIFFNEKYHNAARGKKKVYPSLNLTGGFFNSSFPKKWLKRDGG